MGKPLPERPGSVSAAITRQAILLQSGTRILPPHGFDQDTIMRLETSCLEVTLVTC
jgi:hypothetical protein